MAKAAIGDRLTTISTEDEVDDADRNSGVPVQHRRRGRRRGLGEVPHGRALTCGKYFLQVTRTEVHPGSSTSRTLMLRSGDETGACTFPGARPMRLNTAATTRPGRRSNVAGPSCKGDPAPWPSQHRKEEHTRCHRWSQDRAKFWHPARCTTRLGTGSGRRVQPQGSELGPRPAHSTRDQARNAGRTGRCEHIAIRTFLIPPTSQPAVSSVWINHRAVVAVVLRGHRPCPCRPVHTE